MSEATEESADSDPVQQAQHELLESCLDLVFDTFDEALADKVREPVVFLLDCEDDIGNQIAVGWLGGETVADAIAEQRLADPGSDLTTVFARAFSLAESRQEVPKVFPYLAPVFEQKLPQDGFLAIAITAGGASVFTVPLSAREPKNS